MKQAFSLSTALLILTLSAQALTTSTKTFSSVTSVTVTQAEHGFSSPSIGVNVLDSSGDAITDRTVAIDPLTYNVTVTFPTAQSGSVKVVGIVPADTTDAWTATVSGADFTICNGATTSSPQVKTYNNKRHVCATPLTFTRANSATSGTLRVYRDMSTYKIVFGVSFSTGGGSVYSNPYAEVRNNVSSFPAGSVPLYQISLPAGSSFTGVDPIDKRPW